VQARAKDASDWVRLVIDSATVTGKPISIGLNRDYLLKALRFGLTTGEFIDDLSPVVFSQGGRRMVVMPLRPDSAPPAQSAPPPQSTEPPTAAPNPQPNNHSNPPVNEPTSPAQPQQTSPMPKEPQTQPTETQSATETSPVKAVIQHIEQIKETLKGVLKEFAEVMDGLKQLEKEKRASDKEMESVREKLREIQAVRI
jgi:hypothetical protein